MTTVSLDHNFPRPNKLDIVTPCPKNAIFVIIIFIIFIIFFIFIIIFVIIIVIIIIISSSLFSSEKKCFKMFCQVIDTVISSVILVSLSASNVEFFFSFAIYVTYQQYSLFALFVCKCWFKRSHFRKTSYPQTHYRLR